MKKLLVLLALCMVLAVMFVACNNEPEPPVEETTAGTTEAPTTDAPTTEEPTTEPGTTDTTDTTTPPPPPADPVKAHLSFDECDPWVGETQGTGFFTPGQNTTWDLIANVEDYNVSAIRIWGWVAWYNETPGVYGYQIGDADPVFDDAFTVEAEQGVIDAALTLGGKSGTRMKIMIPVEYVGGEGIVIKALAKDVHGTVETLVEFTLNKPENPNAPVFFVPAADMASSIPGSPDVASAEMSADGKYITITTGTVGDPYYQLPMINNKGYQAGFIAIKYRTTVQEIGGQIFIGSGAGPNGQGDNPVFDYVADGKWHVAIIPLEGVTSITESGINYLRWDMFQRGTDNVIDMAYIGAFQSAEAALAYDAQFKGDYIDVLNTSMDSWTVSGHAPGLTGSDSPDKGGMITAGGLEKGALLHQGSIGLGELNLAQFSKMIVYYGIDNSQVTIDHWTASANNRVMITKVDTDMTNSPADENIVASVGYELKGWSLVAVEIDLTGVDYAGPVFVSYDTLPGTFMLVGAIELVYDPNYVEPEPPVEVPEHYNQAVVLGERNPAGAPLMSPSDKKMGQKLPLGETILKQITIKDLATYADGNTNTWTLKIWAWNTDYATTVAAAPLYEVAGENHNDNATFVLDIPVELLITGDVYYELEYLSGSGGFTGWPANEILIPGVETYIAGAPKEGTYASSVIVGIIGEDPNAGISDKATAGMINESCDTVTLNAGMYFETDGQAYDKLAAVENHITIKSGDVIGFRGWIGFPQAIEQFGFIINDGEFLGGEFKQGTEDVIYTLAGENASRYHITIDTAGTEAGDYTVAWGAKLADGTVVVFYTVTITVEAAA